VVGDGIEEAGDRAAAIERPRPAKENEERRLKRVLRLVDIAQDALAHAQHKRSVPGHQRPERRFNGPALQLGQQLAIALVLVRNGVHQFAQMVQDHIRLSASHVPAP
jgi:hypothetical protein